MVDRDRSAVGPLLQELLFRHAGITWIERESLDAILKEQVLQQAFTAGGGRDRVALGKLLKADVLVLLRTVPLPSSSPEQEQPEDAPLEVKETAKPQKSTPQVKQPAPRQLDVVVCETAQGLRLAQSSIPVTDDAKADATAAAAIVTQAMKKLSEQITTICSVSPFASGDLQYEFDYLKRALSKVVESSLFERQGVLLVELAEAQSIARERALAGQSAVDRPLPLLLLGEYRNVGSGADRSLDVKLRLIRGSTEIDVKSAKNLAPNEVSPFLVRAGNDLLAQIDGHPPLPPSPALEAHQLAKRGRALMQLASWDEAMAMFEASLLVESERTDVMRDAVIVSTYLAQRLNRYTKDIDAIRRAMYDFHRGLEHIEAFVRQVPDQKPYFNRIRYQSIVDEFPFVSLTRMVPPPELVELHATILRTYRETMLRLVRLRAEGLSRDPEIVAGDGTVPTVIFGRPSAVNPKFMAQMLEFTVNAGEANDSRFLWFAFDRLPPQQRFDGIRKMIDELQGLPGFRGRAYRFARGCYTALVFDNPAGREFLSALRSDMRPEVRGAGERITTELAVAMEKFQVADPDSGAYENTAPGEPQLPRADIEAVFHLVEPKYMLPDGKIGVLKNLDGCVQIDQHTDLMWLGDKVLVMQEKDKVLLAFTLKPTTARITDVSFDGKYIWIVASSKPNVSPLVMIFSLSELRLLKLTAEHGLPVARSQEAAKAAATQSLRLVAVEPGKACLAGDFGHSWIGLVDFDPQRPVPVRVQLVLEALQLPDPLEPGDALRSDVAFAPGAMYMVEGERDGKRAKRIVLPREGTNSALHDHSLLIDPDSSKIEVIDEVYPHLRTTQLPPATHDGSLYFLEVDSDVTPTDIRLCRFGFPKLRKESLFHGLPQGRVLLDSGRIHIVGKKWWIGSISDGKFAVASDKLPWRFKNPWPYPGHPDPLLRGFNRSLGFFRSAHYGLIVSFRDSEAGLQAVDFRPRLGASR